MENIVAEDLKIIIENPQLMGVDCDKHHFMIGMIDGKLAIVYVEMTSEKKGEVICASWLHTVEEIKEHNKTPIL